MKKTDLKIAFFGTPIFAVRILKQLEKYDFLPILIVTMPDRPQNRKLALKMPAVKEWALEKNIDVLQPEKLNDEVIAEIQNTEWDLFLVASYGNILPKKLLNIPRYGTLNVHPSLLPKYRGSSPIESQILADDRKTGISIMLMDEKLDHGPIVSQARLEIAEEDWPLSKPVLEDMLATEGGDFLAESILEWVAGDITPEPQDENEATYTKKIKKEDGEINLTGDPRQNFLKIQAFNGWPWTYFFITKNDKKIRIKITSATFQDGELVLNRIIPEGKREMDYSDFIRGNS